MLVATQDTEQLFVRTDQIGLIAALKYGVPP
jgi:hypothetical protein